MNKNNQTQQKYDYFAKQKFWRAVEDWSQKILGVDNWRRQFLKNINGNVLEVAFGDGKSLNFYSKKCCIFALDISLEMLKIAKLRQSSESKIIYIVANAEKLPFTANSFDNIVSIFSLCTINQPSRAVKEVQRVCQLNGKLFFLEHGRSNQKIINKWQKAHTKKHYQRLNCYNNRNIIQIIKERGIKNFIIKRKLWGIFYFIKAKNKKEIV